MLSLIQNRRSPNRDSSPESSDHKAAILTILIHHEALNELTYSPRAILSYVKHVTNKKNSVALVR
jgi:hypothetical protein